MTRAFELNSELEGIALRETYHIPNSDECGKALTLDRWMRGIIRYDFKKRRDLESGMPVIYKNSIETYNSREGVCGEMAILYITLARHAGLDARYASNNETPGHAITRVHTGNGTIDIDHTAFNGFDTRSTSSFFEVDDSVLDEVCSRFRNEPVIHQPVVRTSPYRHPDDPYSGHYHPYSRQHSHISSSQVKAFMVAACFILPIVWNLHLSMWASRRLSNPVSVSEHAEKYMAPAREILSKSLGDSAGRVLLELKDKFDYNNDRNLDSREAYALYRRCVDDYR